MYSRSAGYTIDILVQRAGGGKAGGRGAEEASGAGWAVEVDELGDFVQVLLKPLARLLSHIAWRKSSNFHP